MSELTIEALRARLTAGGLVSNYDVIIGNKSMGLFLENEGFAALPSPTNPTPGVYHHMAMVKVITN